MRPVLQKRRSTRGFALIALLSLLTAGVLYFLVGQLDAAAVQRKGDEATTKALAQAREALIGRAATDDNRPGSLPCPDFMTNIPGNNVPGDGKADMLAGNDCPSYIGWLPWRTLGVADLRDGSGERLWYALSDSLRDDDSAEPINSSTALTLMLDGNSVAAIVIAPGAPLGGPPRPSNNAASYLDGANADGDAAYVSGPAGANFNDRLQSVGSQELFLAVGKRVAAETRGALLLNRGLQRFFSENGTLPMAADASGGGQGANTGGFIPLADLVYDPESSWLNNNNWFALIGYQRNSPHQGTVTVGTRSYAFTFPSP